MTKEIVLHLPEELQRFINERTSREPAASSPSDYIQKLIRQEMEASATTQELEIAKTLIQAGNTPATPVEQDFFQKKREWLRNQSE